MYILFLLLLFHRLLGIENYTHTPLSNRYTNHHYNKNFQFYTRYR